MTALALDPPRRAIGYKSMRVSANIGNIRGSGCRLDSLGSESYLPLIPIHRLSGGAFVRASAFRLRGSFLATRWGGWRPVELKEG
jgi:hypothetical protein